MKTLTDWLAPPVPLPAFLILPVVAYVILAYVILRTPN